ncbi:MAG: flagellar FliJ family protein [bacterium]
MSKAKKARRFEYQMEALLKVRGIRKKQEQDKFEKSEEALREEQKKEQALIDQEEAAYADLLQKMDSDRFPGVHFIQHRKAYIEVMKGKIVEQAKVRVEAEKARDEQREKLITAVKEEKVIEKDKENTREAWYKLMMKEEGKFLDEIAVIGFEHKKRKAQGYD